MMCRTGDPAHLESNFERSPPRRVVAPIGFLAKSPVFQHEEPYAFRYKAELPVPQTNMEMQDEKVDVCDMRGQEEMASLDINGFEVRKLRSKMTYNDFESQTLIERIYIPDIKAQLCEDFGAVAVDIERVRVSRRRKGARDPH